MPSLMPYDKNRAEMDNVSVKFICIASLGHSCSQQKTGGGDGYRCSSITFHRENKIFKVPYLF